MKYIKNSDLRKQHAIKMKEFCLKNYKWDDIAQHLVLNVNNLLNGEEYKVLRDREFLQMSDIPTEDIV